MRQMNKIDEIMFELDMKPISASRPQVYKNGGVGASRSYRKFSKDVPKYIEENFDLEEIEDMKRRLHTSEENIGYKVHVEIVFGRGNEEYWGMPMLIKPDIDNLAKSIFDQVYQYFGVDDKRIFGVDAIKYYDGTNKIISWIEVFEIPEYQPKTKRTTRRGLSSKERVQQLDDEINRLIGGRA